MHPCFNKFSGGNPGPPNGREGERKGERRHCNNAMVYDAFDFVFVQQCRSFFATAALLLRIYLLVVVVFDSLTSVE